MKIFYDWINNSQSINVLVPKFFRDVWTSSENTTYLSTLSNLSSLYFIITAICVILIIKGIILWITQYKLQYMFRITCFIFIWQTLILFLGTLENVFNFHKISFFLPKSQDSEALFFSRPKFQWILSAILCVVMGIVRYHWALPFNMIGNSSSVGFSHLEKTAKSRRQTIGDLSSQMLRNRELGDLNPVYVNGWIPLIDSRSVVKGRAETVIAVGYKFCVFRGENGQVSVLDAYCPHLGADLSAGGKIIGNCVECPFHGWRFDGRTGKCTTIPYAEKIPDAAKVKVWNNCERNGYIFVWHHAENEPPTWQFPSVPEIENGDWLYRGRTEVTVHWHIQELCENSADADHLAQLHKPFFCTFPGSELIRCHFELDWSPDKKESHMTIVKAKFSMDICGYKLPYRFPFEVQQIGPSTAYLYIDPGKGGSGKTDSHSGEGAILMYITTVEPLVQRLVTEIYTAPRFKPFPASFMLWSVQKTLEQDASVWNNKKFLRNPLLVKEDKSISGFRRWYSQFYSEHSPTLKDIRQRTLDW